MGGCSFDLEDEGDRRYYGEGVAMLGDLRDAIADDETIRPLVDVLESIWYCEESDLEYELYEVYNAWPRFVAAIDPKDAGCAALCSDIRLLAPLSGAARLGQVLCGSCSECTRC